jgi:hypothetical protein
MEQRKEKVSDPADVVRRTDARALLRFALHPTGAKREKVCAFTLFDMQEKR